MPTALVPELYVSELEVSLSFYCETLGFDIKYERPDDRFVYLNLGEAELMLEEPFGRTWLAAPMERPYGRGINLQILVDSTHDVFARCKAKGHLIIQPLETRAYRTDRGTIEQTQFVVQDPDGYLIRLAQLEKQ